jgi:prophage antirepressor-like protein
MSDLVRFDFEGHAVRVREEMFVAKDVCAALDLENATMALQGLDDDEVSKFTEVDSGGIPRTYLLLTEAGVYQLAFRSRKAAAKRFRRWLTHEVIPAIRKTGSYGTPQAFDAAQVAGVVMQIVTPLFERMMSAVENVQGQTLEHFATIGPSGARHVKLVLREYALAMSGDDKRLRRSIRSAIEKDLRSALGFDGTGRSWDTFPRMRWSDLQARLEEIRRAATRMGTTQTKMFS